MYTRFKGRWVYFSSSLEEIPFKAKILALTEEAGIPCYSVELPDGRRELIFINAIDAIQAERRPKAKILPLKKKLRLIK